MELIQFFIILLSHFPIFLEGKTGICHPDHCGPAAVSAGLLTHPRRPRHRAAEERWPRAQLQQQAWRSCTRAPVLMLCWPRPSPGSCKSVRKSCASCSTPARQGEFALSEFGLDYAVLALLGAERKLRKHTSRRNARPSLQATRFLTLP